MSFVRNAFEILQNVQQTARKIVRIQVAMRQLAIYP